ncbi:MAG: ribosomal protein S18 acetylase RimI-like enzyme [Paraglaciecola sp.]|jgi:ribosomal protein S18 acetylase RimI-like enzyme
MPAAIHIRPVEPHELSDLMELGKRTYRETFQDGNTIEDMEQYLERAFNKERIEREYYQADSHFFFACYGDHIAGYLKFNTGEAQTEPYDLESMELQRIYVDAPYQGLQIGQVMMDFTVQYAKEQGATSIWLGVWEKNIKAIHFYERNGFVNTGAHDFLMGTDLQQDLLMHLVLEDYS